MGYSVIKCLKVKNLKFEPHIPKNIEEENVQPPYSLTKVINGNALIGRNCRINVCVNIEESRESKEAPKISDDFCIATVAEIYGVINIADRITRAAGAAIDERLSNSDKLPVEIPMR